MAIISAILATLASAAVFTAIPIAESELRNWLGGLSRSKLESLNAKITATQEKNTSRINKINEMVSALQSMALSNGNSSIASKLRASRVQKIGKMRKERESLEQKNRDLGVEQALVNQDINNSYNYAGAISNLVHSDKYQKLQNSVEEALNNNGKQ